MSPEQAQGNKTVDYRSDLWSLGVIAFECIVGKRPFFSDGLGDLVLTICVRDLPVPSDTAPVPLGFDKWFARACNREPGQRFQSARELTEGLRDALGIEGLALDTPEIVVKSEGGPKSSAPPGGVPTLAGDSVALSRGPRRADPDALTMAAGPIDADVPAPTEALFGTTQAHLPEPRSNTGIVFMVAGAALAAGIVGGFLFLRKSAAPAGELDSRTTFVPATTAPAASEPPPNIDETDALEGTDENADVADAAADAAAADAAVADAAVADAALADSGIAGRGAPAAFTEPDVAPIPASDAGWQKPDWAKPDNEIPVRRGPGEEDKKIVIPKEEQ
jgi:serine/threonine-protein kinase